MPGILESLRGVVRLEATGANPADLLNRLTAAGVTVIDCEPAGSHTVRLKVSPRHRERTELILKQSGCELGSRRGAGLPFLLLGMRKRAVLFAGLIAVLVSLLWSSFYIWDIEVTGNDEVSAAEILFALENCGVDVGTFWPGIDQSAIRNYALEQIPRLSFLTVNVSGSRAEVVVRERTPKPEIFDEAAPTNVVASRGGIITSVRAYSGTAVTAPGKTVAPGELLVAGNSYTYIGAPMSHARAQVFARTWYDITAVAPLYEEVKSYTGDKSLGFAFIFGKNRVNLLKGTGNISGEYDTITQRHRLAIQNLFALPLTLEHTTLTAYTTIRRELDPADVEAFLEQRLLDNLSAALGEGGSITAHSFTLLTSGDYLYVTIHAECLEDIAQEAPIPQPASDLPS